MKIYILRDHKEYGPFTPEEAQAHMEAGDLLPNDSAWHAQSESWLPLEGVLSGKYDHLTKEKREPIQGKPPKLRNLKPDFNLLNSSMSRGFTPNFFSCARCGHVGDPARGVKGNGVIELILWIVGVVFCFTLIFPLIALIYSIWRHSNVPKICLMCGSSDIIPTSSPNAQQHLKDVQAASVEKSKDEEDGLEEWDDDLYLLENTVNDEDWRELLGCKKLNEKKVKILLRSLKASHEDWMTLSSKEIITHAMTLFPELAKQNALASNPHKHKKPV